MRATALAFLAILTHDSLAAGTATQTAPQTTVDASRGGVTIASGDNSLTLGARVQFRWTVEDREQFDGDAEGSGVGVADGVSSAFAVPRARLTLKGGVYRPWLKYLLQFEMSWTDGESDSKIKDAAIEIRPANPAFRLFLGQFKVPFGLQQSTSSGALQFVDRAITDGKFNPGRDTGVLAGGRDAGSKWGYSVGVFNGAGESRAENDNAALLAGRVFVNPLAPYNWMEGSSDAPADAMLHLGAAFRTGEPIPADAPAGVSTNVDNQTAFNGEFAVKTARFYSTAEYFWATDEQRNPIAGRSIQSSGFHVQAGVMLVPGTTETAFRYARIEGDRDIDDAALREIRGAFSYYWQEHDLKLQADVGRISYGPNFMAMPARARAGLPQPGTRLVSGEPLSDTQVRMQFQVAF